MEPVAIVTSFVAFLYVAGRGGFFIAPGATVAFYRRTIYATDTRMRIFGGSLLFLVAAPLIVTARQASPAAGGILVLLQGLGWITAAASAWVVATPDLVRRLANRTVLGASHPTLRIKGALSVAFGLFLGWNAFFVL